MKQARYHTKEVYTHLRLTRINLIQQLISIHLLTSRENDNLKLLRHSLQKLRQEGSAPHMYLIIHPIELYGEDHVSIGHRFNSTMDKCFIEVQYKTNRMRAVISGG